MPTEISSSHVEGEGDCRLRSGNCNHGSRLVRSPSPVPPQRPNDYRNAVFFYRIIASHFSPAPALEIPRKQFWYPGPRGPVGRGSRTTLRHWFHQLTLACRNDFKVAHYRLFRPLDNRRVANGSVACGPQAQWITTPSLSYVPTFRLLIRTFGRTTAASLTG
jgi:hypothetical protein